MRYWDRTIGFAIGTASVPSAAAGENAEGTEAERRRALKRALRTLQRLVEADAPEA